MRFLILSLALIVSMFFNYTNSTKVHYLTGQIAVLSQDNVTLETQLDYQQSSRSRMINYLETKYSRYLRNQKDKVIRLVDYVEAAAQEFDVDPNIILAQMSAESSFDPSVESHVGALSLMQVMPFWTTSDKPDAIIFQTETGITSIEILRNPRQNVRAGAWIIANYVKQCGGMENGLKCYHGGYKAIDRPKTVTIEYVERVLERYYSI